MSRLQYYIFSLCLLFSTTLPATEPPPADTPCAIDPATADWAAWQQCQDRLVNVTATIAPFAMQHPTGLHDTLDPIAKVLDRKHETYLNTPRAQLVITSNEPIECAAQIDIEGVVDLIDLGGETGKHSYKNVWIKLQRYTCQ